MSLFSRKYDTTYYEAVLCITLGIRKNIYPDGIFPLTTKEATERKDIGLFRMGDRLFDIMIEPTRTMFSHFDRGYRVIHRFSVSEEGKKILSTVQRFLKHDGIILGDLKACVKIATKDIERKEIKLNGSGFDAPEFDLPLSIARHNRQTVIFDHNNNNLTKTARDFTVWFGAEVLYPPIIEG